MTISTATPTPVAARPRARERAAFRRRGALARLGQIVGRSLFPISAVLLIASAALLGPWFTLVGAFVWWRIVARFA